MRADLADAQASVDWAKAQLPSIAQRVGQWVTENVDMLRLETAAPSAHDRIVALPKAAFPLAFNVEIGACLGVLRGSLDILATAVAYRHGVRRADKANFPIARSAAAFARGHYNGHQFVEGLPEGPKAVIEALKPYKGGNAALWALHQLDIVRKHRRLLVVEISPHLVRLRPTGPAFGLDDFTPGSPGRLEADQETELGLIRKDAPDCKVEITPKILIDEADVLGRPEPAIELIHVLADCCQFVIRLFD